MVPIGYDRRNPWYTSTMRIVLQPHVLEARPAEQPGHHLVVDPSDPDVAPILVTDEELRARYQPLPEPPAPPKDRLELATRLHDALQQVILTSGAVTPTGVELTLIIEQLLLLASSYAHMKSDDTEEAYVDFARDCYQHVGQNLRDHAARMGSAIALPK